MQSQKTHQNYKIQSSSQIDLTGKHCTDNN